MALARSRPSAYYQLEMWRQVKRARSTAGGAQAGSAGGPKPRHQLLLPGRAQSHKSPARKSCGFACERVSACILCARQVIKTIWWRNARSVQYTAVYCSILQYTEMFGNFFLIFWSLAAARALLVSQMKKMKMALCTCAESPCPEPEPKGGRGRRESVIMMSRRFHQK